MSKPGEIIALENTVKEYHCQFNLIENMWEITIKCNFKHNDGKQATINYYDPFPPNPLSILAKVTYEYPNLRNLLHLNPL